MWSALLNFHEIPYEFIYFQEAQVFNCRGLFHFPLSPSMLGSGDTVEQEAHCPTCPEYWQCSWEESIGYRAKTAEMVLPCLVSVTCFRINSVGSGILFNLLRKPCSKTVLIDTVICGLLYINYSFTCKILHLLKI